MVPTTAAEWAQAYAELAAAKDAQLSVLTKEHRILLKEKDALAKEKGALAKEKDALAKEKDAQLAVLIKEKDALATEKDVLATQLAQGLSQCSGTGNSTGLSRTLRRTLVAGRLCPCGADPSLSALTVACAVCAAVAAVDAAVANPPRQAAAAGATPRQGTPCARRDGDEGNKQL